jgi:hypothetical protein
MSAVKRPASRRSPTAGNKGQGSNWCWRPTRLKIYQRDGYRCVWCLAPVLDGPALKAAPAGSRERCATLDHFLARSRGGSNAPSNLLTSCAECNEKRDDMNALEWVTLITKRTTCGDCDGSGWTGYDGWGGRNVCPTCNGLGYSARDRAYARAAILERCITALETPLQPLAKAA